ncbi:esterase/lipase family protein [Laceyella putida]|uniref:Esterase/lipase family protein n=1 Tax=Laceyella putida TaxID=110101 RepID=A0ABW2RLM5_9BACL
MQGRRQVWLMLLVSVLLIMPFGTAGASGEIPKPQAMGQVVVDGANMEALPPPGSSTAPGTWFVGATPANADTSKPPIVFVQGLHGRAQSWWEETSYHGVNDMYETAYNNGYRTAFVQLYDAPGGDAANPWDNGRLLAGMLEQIHNYYGQKVNIVAHSKGGPDTQAALIHYGAYRFVNKVVTLGSPHEGSHLADLAYSSWAGWLADLLGQQDAGTYSLQVGEMAKFREQTDNHANARQNRYYTTAGTSWGPTFSALAAGGLYLWQYGDNDGLVNVWSTDLPYGTHLFTADLDHDEIRTGRAVFSRIESTLRTATASVTQKVGEPLGTAEAVNKQEAFVRGGALAGQKEHVQQVPVEAGVKEAVFLVRTKASDTQVVLVSPSGKEVKQVRMSKDGEFFRGATVQEIRVAKPEAGNWQVKLLSKGEDAYLLTAHFMGTSTVELDLPALHKEPSTKLKVKLKGLDRIDFASLTGKIKIVDPQGQTREQSLSKGKMASAELTGDVLGKQAGVYNITVELSGKTKDGQPYARTLVKSVYIGK